MKRYGGIDLHSNHSVVALLDGEDRIVYRRRLANELAGVLEALVAYLEGIEGLVVESTCKGYWLVDALMEAGYRVHLANTMAIVPYTGLKFSDGESVPARRRPTDPERSKCSARCHRSADCRWHPRSGSGGPL